MTVAGPELKSPILAIDTSSAETSIALWWPDGRICEKAVPAVVSHGEELAAVVADSLLEDNLKVKDLGGLAVGRGPGSFTGLRIGFAFMAGLAVGASLPIVTISSLAAAALLAPKQWRWIGSISDARRGECFVAGYLRVGPELASNLEPTILPANQVQRALESANDAVDGGGGFISPDLELAELALDSAFQCAHCLAKGVASLASKVDVSEWVRGAKAVAGLSPEYLRHVAARTIVERARDSAL